MKELRFHGRGGQGVVTAIQILGSAFTRGGKYASSFPMFGVERRGAPVSSFLRFDDRPIRQKCMIYHPDCVIVFEPSHLILPSTFAGVKSGCILIADTDRGREAVHDCPAEIHTAGLLNATGIALDEIGVPVANTCMLGAIARTTDWIALEHLLNALGEFFSGNQLESNVRSCRRGHEEVDVIRLVEKGP